MGTNLSDTLPYFRTLLFDNTSPYTYTDVVLKDFLRNGFWKFEINTNQGYDINSDVITPDLSKKNQFIIAMAAMILFTRAKVANDSFITVRRFKQYEIEQEYQIGATVLREYLQNIDKEYEKLIKDSTRSSFSGEIVETTFVNKEAIDRYASSVSLGAFVYA